MLRTAYVLIEGVGDDVVVLGTKQRLPLFGNYQTTAVITSDNFHATFTSRNDSGHFVMSRRR
jgi:hypothetical protein